MDNNNNINDDELKIKTNSKALNSQNPSNNNPPLPGTTREEGELSSSEDDDDSIAPIGPTPVPPFNKAVQLRHHISFAGKATFSKNPAKSVDVQSRPSLQPNNDKSFEKNRVPLKSANSGWHAPPGPNSNLVISFSDDDTGSESEDYKSGKALEYKQKTAGVDSNQRPPSSLLAAKSNKLQLTARNVNKVMPKKSLSRTFNSATTKINGGAHSRGAGSSSVDQISRVRNFNTTNRNLSNQEYGSDQGLGMNNAKLQDLRLQIALRERVLKLKAAHQNKESASVSGRDYSFVNLAAHATRTSNATSVRARELEAKEQDNKRLKIMGSTQLASDRQQEIHAVKSTIPLKEQALRSNSLLDRVMVHRGLKGSPTRRTESSIVKSKEQVDKRVDTSSESLPSGLKEGVNVNINRIQTDRCNMQVEPLTNIKSSVLLKYTNSVELNQPVKSGGHQPPGSFSKTTSGEQHLMSGGEDHEHILNDRRVGEALNKVCQASLDNGNPWNYFGALNVSAHNNVDMNSLVEMEESLDKELEEAQEQRHICEIEERNALKAYRKAQRALVEANSRCAELYHKRELYSAHFRSLVLNDSTLLWSTRNREHVGIALNHTDNGSRNLELMPPSSHPERPDYDGRNQPGFDSNIQCASGAPLRTPYMHANGQNLGSEPCSEPDASTSEPLHLNRKTALNIGSSPSNDPNFSADDDEETSPLDHETVQPNYKIQQREESSVGRQKDSINQLNKISSDDCSPDSLTLEATLRSELFARLGRRNLSKNSSSLNLDPADELGTENDNGSERTQTSNGSFLVSEEERNQEFDLGGNDQHERNISGVPVNIQNQRKNDDEYFSICHLSATIIYSPNLVLRSAFGHMKDTFALTSTGFQSQKSERDDTCDCNDEAGSINTEEIDHGITIANPMEESAKDVCGNDFGSFTCNFIVDPFWPLCMYELRGKCNNDQCPWQHVRDFSNGNVGKHQHDTSDSSDCQVGLTLHQKKCNGGTLPNSQCVLTAPTYIVGLDILKSDSHSFDSVVTWGNGQCWQKCFSICIALSNLLQKDLPADEPFLHGSDGRIEVQKNWDKQLSYFQSRNSIVNHLNQMLPSNLQSVEVAFLMLNQEVNKLEGMKKALSVLSRAIEADPKSEILWITYLFIYYGNVKSVAKDDMFSYAVKHNDRSYGVWLMYINSRTRLDDRLVAYESALTALCHQLSAYEKDEMYASACILDMFLQMMDFLCMSGNVEKAIQKICGLFSVATNSDQCHCLLLSDILASLTISDKCMFWVCCVYLVMYRKLPEAVVHKFECDKELLAIEWPCVHLLDEDKQMATKLVEMAMNFVKLYVNSESVVNEASLRSLQYFGLCHTRCVAALHGLECCRSLLDEYMKLYPACLEYVLVSVRVQMTDSEGFEEALRNWPKEAPGIHCIWNQYIEYALQKGGPDFAKRVIVRWFNSFSVVQYSQKEKLDAIGTSSSHASLELASAENTDFLTSSSNHLDLMFGYLNLSIAKLLHNDQIEARNAIDKAFKAAAPPFFEHCLREHAMFLLMNDSQLNEDASISKCLNVLNGYLDDARAFPVSEPLSRRFINKIEKPRVKQLIGNMLSPVSFNFFLVNLVLEVWYGPSLLPQNFRQPKELVDFVEAILEIVPSNYQLAFSACKLLSKGENFIDVPSGSMLYWASITLVNSIFHAIPIAPEYVWVDAAGFLDDIAGIELICERFYRKALSVYPFSIKLWNCYYNLSKTRGHATSVLEAAREKGIELG
ncbi:uncharacterized protein LOC8265969 isoform X1 [Ricinus communis]|uniref:uncharacterized protein LOC8265969 isoform X1 n=1 Tax=Ricinus communis TaxID=3988 RepID=UPI00201B09D6|nr:uncharacterized protein LOC8265969 isoform X1 [Ricinus communis]